MRGLELADHSLGLVVEGGDDDLVGILVRVVKSQAADCENDDLHPQPAGTRQTSQDRRPLRVELSAHRPGARYVWRFPGPDFPQQLRHGIGPALLGLRTRLSGSRIFLAVLNRLQRRTGSR